MVRSRYVTDSSEDLPFSGTLTDLSDQLQSSSGLIEVVFVCSTSEGFSPPSPNMYKASPGSSFIFILLSTLQETLDYRNVSLVD